MILDNYGNPVTSAVRSSGHYVASKRTLGRSRTQAADKDFKDLLPELDHRTLLSASRSLFGNNGVFKACISQKAEYSVGKGFEPVFNGADKDWSKQATEWLTNWFGICDVRGGVYNFKKSLLLDSIGMDRDGDTFCLLTKTPTGYPQLQHIPAHRIGCKAQETTVDKGAYRGLRIVNGAILNRYGRVVAWRVLGDYANGYKDVSARDLIGLYEPLYVDQHRGVCAFSHAINDFKALAKSQDYELTAMQLASSIGLVVNNEDGEANPDDFYGASDSGVHAETIEGGTVRYFEAGKGQSIDTLESNRPSPNWRAFGDRVTRAAIAGVGWSTSLLLEPEGNGTADRVQIVRAEKAISSRQETMTPFALMKIRYGLSVAIERGDLPYSKDWYKWTMSTPKKLSIDLGRDMSSTVKAYDTGLKNLTQIVAEDGRTVEEVLRERAYEISLAERIRLEVEKETGVKIDPRRMRLLTPNEQPAKDEE